MADLAQWADLVARESGLVVAATARADGAIQSTVVNAGAMEHPLDGKPIAAYVAGGRVKLDHMRARPWTSLTARVGWEWLTVEGDVELAGPDDPLPGIDDVPALLRAVFAAAGGTHDDWAEFDRVMREDRRVAVLVRPRRVYGNPGRG